VSLFTRRPPDTPQPSLLTLNEAAALTRVSVMTARRWAKSGRIPSQRLPGPTGKILIPRDALLDLLRGAGETSYEEGRHDAVPNA
jgi:excisionase family DNA binding protein